MMEATFLYRQIVDAVRQQILQGELKPGDRLPTVREMMVKWNCTIGTVQRAYQELVRQGLVTSRAGQGTRVVGELPVQDETPLRRAALFHRAEAFLLEALTAGHPPADVEEAVRQALERWRVVSQEATVPASNLLNFTGSHDLVVAWMATHFTEIAPGYTLHLSFTGSLGGLIALVEGKADIAGCHLWDEQSDTYNTPFVQRLLPGQRVALVTLAHRRLGWIVPPGNPRRLQNLADLAQPGLRFVNRQAGSGTRVWLDASLRRTGISPVQIQGYTDERMTHSDVARSVAEGRADVGLGLEAAARTYGLDFVSLTQERYDLVIPAASMDLPPVRALTDWLGQPEAREMITSLAGYGISETGQIRRIGGEFN
jgi:molybdate-binding protein/DNA-binding transcriptional regulator YhcF (GntR family)